MCVQYIGGHSVNRRCSLHRGVFSTLGEIMSTLGVFITLEGTMSASGKGGYHEYIGGCSVNWGTSWCMWGIPWVHWGMFSTSGYHEYIWGYHEYIWVFIRNWKDLSSCSPTCPHDVPLMYWTSPLYSWYSPWCTHDIPPDVLMVFPQCTEHLPIYTWYPPHS